MSNAISDKTVLNEVLGKQVLDESDAQRHGQSEQRNAGRRNPVKHALRLLERREEQIDGRQLGGAQPVVLDQRVDRQDRARGEEAVRKHGGEYVSLQLPAEAAAGDFDGAGLRGERGRRGKHDEAGCNPTQVRVEGRERADDGEQEADQRNRGQQRDLDRTPHSE